ncbi:MAG TPA: hypothetical protein PKI93_06370 [Alphaproteobacteria bacterium]|nr:hypothetical protein [Alphaproteobacteria bacterium]HNS44550.1 hypothetical protein [Alphaproteobacteria bacterium]
MFYNLIKRVIPCVPQIRSFPLQSQEKAIDVELVITTSIDEIKTISLCTRHGNKLEWALLKSNSSDNAKKFVTMLWETCKSETNYTLVNMTLIGNHTARLFPDFAFTRELVDTIEEKLNLNEEMIAAYLTGVKSVRHKSNIAIYQPAENSYPIDRRPLAEGSLAFH